VTIFPWCKIKDGAAATAAPDNKIAANI
jgi:hypothetical protein